MTPAPGPTYRAALIGCGAMGSFYADDLAGYPGRTPLPIGHAEVLTTHPRTELVAGTDPDAGRLAEFGRRWGVDRLYADHQTMLDRERPELVSIASPPPLHPRHVIDCAERGVRGIFCEKPLAPTLREADAMLAACAANGARLCINHTLRGDPYALRARELIRAGTIGDLLTVTISWGGRLFLTGTHRFDLVNFLLDECPTDWLVGHAELPAGQVAMPTRKGSDVGGTAYVVYRNGVRAFFNGRDGTPLERVEIVGTRGVIAVDSAEAGLWVRHETSRWGELLRHPFPQQMRFTAPMVYLLDDLIEAIETGRDPMSNGATARHALTQILATHHSSAQGSARVNFPFELADLAPPYRWSGSPGDVPALGGPARPAP